MLEVVALVVPVAAVAAEVWLNAQILRCWQQAVAVAGKEVAQKAREARVARVEAAAREVEEGRACDL